MAAERTEAQKPEEMLERESWAPFLNRVSPLLQGQSTEVEVASLRLGDQIAAEWVSILAISYDHKDDVVSVVLDGLDHLIYRPQRLTVRRRGAAVESLAITDAEGTMTLVRFREPAMLPPPQAQHADGVRP